MHVAITGSHGLIGSALADSLEADGHTVHRVIRDAATTPTHIPWDIDAGTIDAQGFAALDAVVHLAGAGIASRRWSEAHKRAVLESRTRGTSLLSEALAGLDRPPPVLVSGSAIGYYGDRGDEELTEDSPAGQGFLPELCRAWEAATGLAEAAGIRVCHVRTGIVLSADGGALGAQLLPFRLGLGARAGRGDQWMPWISIDDHVRALRHCIDTPSLAGPVNLVGPAPAANATFTRTLAGVLRRPAFLVVPRLATKAPAGVGPLVEDLLFSSARVLPRALDDSGFTFSHQDLEQALRAVLDRPS